MNPEQIRRAQQLKQEIERRDRNRNTAAQRIEAARTEGQRHRSNQDYRTATFFGSMARRELAALEGTTT